MNEDTQIRLTLVGLGLEATALGLVQAGFGPHWLPWLVVVVGLLVIGYGLSPFPATGVRWVALYLPMSPKRTETREQDVSLAARLRWDDDVGKPLVNAPEGRMRHIWAALDIEVRNHARHPQRITDLYLEIRHAERRKFRRLIATADPVKVDNDFDWHKRRFPRRVEWELAPVSEAISHHVRFDRGWSQTDQDAPRDPRTFDAAIVAELGIGRPIRLLIGQDIWRTGEAPNDTPPA